MAERSDIVHLLRRTEYVARRERIDQLVPMTLEAAVDDVLATPADPGSVTFTQSENWQQGVELTHYWLDRMAHDSPKPLQEKMAFFWHGHFCSESSKVGSGIRMREQIDLWRDSGLGNLRNLAKVMSRQVAMLRYLDNNRNQNTSPNQNFARELMELFLLGVGNYTEADVEAATAAWTGHTDDWQTDEYVWRADWHDGSSKQFLGRTINASGAAEDHGDHTIDVMLGGTALGDGTIPTGSNAGRSAPAVVAEFISRKLWIEFAGTSPSATVLGALRDEALANDFEIRPWLRALLLRPEFYSTDVKDGLVRSPVEFMVATLHATGHRSVNATPLWLMEGMGQRPLYPPNVSGWKHNGYWVNASAMAKRIDTSRSFMWRSLDGYWDNSSPMQLGRGTLTRAEVESDAPTSGKAVLDQMLDLMDIELSTATYDALLAYDDIDRRWYRPDWISLILMSPDMHVA